MDNAMIRRLTCTAALAALVLAQAACKRTRSTPAEADDNPVLATVNGVSIRQLDVDVKLQSRGAKGKTGLNATQVLETIIQDELLAQRAVELGLDADPVYQRKLRRSAAELAGLRREGLGDLFQQKEIVAKASVTEDDARRYFDEHSRRLRTTVRVGQILRRSEHEIEAVRAQLASGKSFEEVAEAGVPKLPPDARRPWDLGKLRWEQLPEEWSAALETLEPGKTSEILRGASGRFWIVKLFERTEDPAVTFEQLKAAILARLQPSRALTLRAEAEKSLRDRARIERRRAPLEVPAEHVSTLPPR
jgi:hypothetical protein